jgi:hypothetical protein
MCKFLTLATVREPPVDGSAIKGLPCDRAALHVKAGILAGTGKPANLKVNAQTTYMAKTCATLPLPALYSNGVQTASRLVKLTGNALRAKVRVHRASGGFSPPNR